MKLLRFLWTGAAAGLLNGLFGAGGGMVTVPMLEKDGLPAQQAHATSLAVIAPLSVLSGGCYLWQGRMALGDAWGFLLPGLAGAVLGGWLLPRLKALWLHRAFGILILIAAGRLLFS